MPGRHSSLPEGKLVETYCGSVKGIVSKSRDGRDFNEWRGIPYGQPPIGPLRFASPKPYGKWDGTRDGSKFGSVCPDLNPLGKVIGDEDCLYLNVAAPQMEISELLPVMVFIHGGAFQNGSGSIYGPHYFMDEYVIIVTLNYRLGVLGFLNTGDTVIRGNMGLKDQALALRWVKDNIKFFGGNPNQITIFGESAGGASVHHLMLSPSTRGLFNKAISESGVACASWAIESTKEAVKYTRKYAERFNCRTDDSSKIAECLRSKSVKDLLTEYSAERGEILVAYTESHYFRPSIEAVNDDEAFLTEHPLKILAEGKAQRVPWMTGVNADEGLLFTMLLYNSEKEIDNYEKDFENTIRSGFGLPKEHPEAQKLSDIVHRMYFPPKKFITKDEKLAQYTRLFSDVCHFLPLSHCLSIQKELSPVYPYHFSRRGGPSLTPLMDLVSGRTHIGVRLAKFIGKAVYNKATGKKPRDYGVCHADELAMLFQLKKMGFDVQRDKNPDDYNFSKDMVKLWVQFATDESSMTFRGVHFPAQEPRKEIQFFDISETPRIIPAPFAARVDALNELGIIDLPLRSDML